MTVSAETVTAKAGTPNLQRVFPKLSEAAADVVATVASALAESNQLPLAHS